MAPSIPAKPSKYREKSQKIPQKPKKIVEIAVFSLTTHPE
jgi:hypothetical protein